MAIISGLITKTSPSQQHVAYIVSHLGDARGCSLSISPLLGLEGWLSLRFNILACTSTQNGITVCIHSKFGQSLFKCRLFCLLINQLFQQVCGGLCSLSRPWHLRTHKSLWLLSNPGSVASLANVLKLINQLRGRLSSPAKLSHSRIYRSPLRGTTAMGKIIKG